MVNVKKLFFILVAIATSNITVYAQYVDNGKNLSKKAKKSSLTFNLQKKFGVGPSVHMSFGIESFDPGSDSEGTKGYPQVKNKPQGLEILIEPKSKIDQISEQNTRKARALELLINKSISSDEYQKIRKECENAIIRFEAELKELRRRVDEDLDIEGLADLAVDNLKNLPEFYATADPDIKRAIVGRSILKNGFLMAKNIEPLKLMKSPSLSTTLTGN